MYVCVFTNVYILTCIHTHERWNCNAEGMYNWLSATNEDIRMRCGGLPTLICMCVYICVCWTGNTNTCVQLALNKWLHVSAETTAHNRCTTRSQ